MATDFAAWVGGCRQADGTLWNDTPLSLAAFTIGGRVPIAYGSDLADLRRYPLDRLALVPSTSGGMVTAATARGTIRVVCADLDGEVAVLEGHPGGPAASGDLGDDDVDHEVLALLWLLMDVRATRPSVTELVARVLAWGWVGAPQRLDGMSAGSDGHDGEDEGLAHLAVGDLAGLARLLDVALPRTADAEGVRALAAALGHPSLDWEALPWVVTEEQRLDFLHACLPTRWSVAHDLRTIDGRDDLAALLMDSSTHTG